MTSATERIRAMLDERGVEWDYGITGSTTTRFNVNGIDLTFTPMRDGLVCSTILTPEQAIAATLGATDANPTQAESLGTCHDIGTFKSWGLFTCSNCSIVIPLNAAKDAPEVGKSVPLNYCPNCGAKVLDPTTNDAGVEVDA